MEVLRVERLSRRFDGVDALKNVSLSLAQGERRALIGPNGAGKTTLFNLITGVLRPSSGEIYLFGQNVKSGSPARRAALGLARSFQITSLFQELTVLQNVLLAVQGCKPFRFDMVHSLLKYKPAFIETRKLLNEWGLEEKSNLAVKHLSYGEQRLMELVLCLASQPKILLLDEPTAGLAPAEVAGMVAAVRKVAADTALLIVEHDMDVTFEVADTITVLHEGTVVAEGSKEAIRCDARVQEIYLGTERPK